MDDYTLDIDDLTEEQEKQLEEMRSWFFENYENPVHSCPYISKEGGYQYIYGGPYDAADELGSKFGGSVDDKLIEFLVAEVEEDCIEWSGRDYKKPDYYDDPYFFEDIGSLSNPYLDFQVFIKNLQNLLNINTDAASKELLLKMAYVNLVTSLEAYLFEVFTSKVENDEYYFRRFIESYKPYKTEKISLSIIFEKQEKLKNKVKQDLSRILWHNIPMVQALFKEVLEIEFKEKAGPLKEAMHIRHDLVHRNGKDKEGNIINLTINQINDLMDQILTLVEHIHNSESMKESF
ncbi:HEPN domain-containing protein [Spartinivicinus ruber]|uniref:HEPN domain-containing protein n=1 Tax=Spartinivicinus ruber TaxID=2683272 RepID=UPI0013D480F5|nr:HEPN domain-containing protein [Spartinivicinus ruber]